MCIGCGFDLSMFVLSDPVPRRQTNRICKGHEDHWSCYVYWRRLKSKRSLPVLEWTSESEHFERLEFFFQTYYTSQHSQLKSVTSALFLEAHPLVHFPIDK